MRRPRLITTRRSKAGAIVFRRQAGGFAGFSSGADAGRDLPAGRQIMQIGIIGAALALGSMFYGGEGAQAIPWIQDPWAARLDYC
jgi:hypothetical protein